jgi:aryl-alcohol dehydrogenase-like predicted oxidoreductase
MQYLREHGGGARRAEGRVLKSLQVHGDQIQQDEELADRLGHQPGDAALAWLLAQPAVTALIVGPRTQEQLTPARRALDLGLDELTLIRLDEISPGHRAAPEYRAW